MREVKEDRPAGDMPDHLVREAPGVLTNASEQFIWMSDGQRWASSDATLSLYYGS